MTTTPRRGFARALTGCALGTALLLAAPLAASAHVGISPEEVPRGGSAVVTFSFTHGCEHSPTTSLRIEVPNGLDSVSPTADANWLIAVEHRANGLVSAVTYTAVQPVASELRGAVSMAVRISRDAPDSLVFPVVQTCQAGVHRWTDIAAEGQDPHELDSPAPVLRIVDAPTTDHHVGHGEGSGSTASEGPDAASVLTWGLIAANLAISLAALTVALRTARRSRT